MQHSVMNKGLQFSAVHFAIFCTLITVYLNEVNAAPSTKQNLPAMNSKLMSEYPVENTYSFYENIKRASEQPLYEVGDELDRYAEPDERLEKRSAAIARPNFRPSKRSEQGDAESQADRPLVEKSKRSAAIGRANFRPAKRSAATGRVGFRPAKRSMPNENLAYYWI